MHTKKHKRISIIKELLSYPYKHRALVFTIYFFLNNFNYAAELKAITPIEQQYHQIVLDVCTIGPETITNFKKLPPIDQETLIEASQSGYELFHQRLQLNPKSLHQTVSALLSLYITVSRFNNLVQFQAECELTLNKLRKLYDEMAH